MGCHEDYRHVAPTALGRVIASRIAISQCLIGNCMTLLAELVHPGASSAISVSLLTALAPRCCMFDFLFSTLSAE
jgi:hypothetical protein